MNSKIFNIIVIFLAIIFTSCTASASNKNSSIASKSNNTTSDNKQSSSPSTTSLDGYSVAQAVKHNDVVNLINGSTYELYNELRLNEFIRNYKEKKEDYLRITQVLKADGVEYFDFIRDVYYKDGKINVIEYNCKSGKSIFPTFPPEFYDDISLSESGNKVFCKVNKISDTELLKILDYDKSSVVSKLNN